MKEKIFDDMNAGPFKAKVDERFHKLGQDCPNDGWVTGYLLRDLHQGEILPHIFNCPCTWIVEEETIEPVGFHIAQWIKVEDRLPEKGQLCIMRTNSGLLEVGTFEILEDGFAVFRIGTSAVLLTISSITHWQEIAPPKED